MVEDQLSVDVVTHERVVDRVKILQVRVCACGGVCVFVCPLCVCV